MACKEFDVYADNGTHRIEYLSHGRMIVVDIASGDCAVIPIEMHIKNVIDEVKKHGDEKVIKTYLSLIRQFKQKWEPLYKPGF